MSDVPTPLLRDALRTAADDSSSGCLDAQTIAAWADGALTGRARAAAEAHAASCARCQAVLAAMARTAPASEPRQTLLSPWRLAWLAPIAAAVAAVAIWVNAPRPRMALAPAPATGAASESPSPPREFPQKTLAAPSANLDAQPLPRDGRAVSQPARVEPKPAPAAPPALTAAEPQPKIEQSPAELRDASPVPPPPAASPAVRPDSEAAGSGRRTFEARAALAPQARAEAAASDIATPNPQVRWRLLDSGLVSRTEDGGTTWQTQSTGLSAIRAASAPSVDVCWVVGPAGGIAATTDGRTWHRVSFPEGAEAVAVRATDALNAAVTLADRRVLVTSDGGRSWR